MVYCLPRLREKPKGDIGWELTMALRFRKRLIADQSYESVGVFDVNNDGSPDIVSGAWWYEGPGFHKRHPVGDVRAEGEYFDDFSTIPMDVNGDGLTDFITGGWWGGTLRWRENPGDADKEWPEHVIAETGSIETTRAWDVDGDGVAEIVPNTPGGPLVVYKLVTDGQGRGTGEFEARVISDRPQGHGLGCGDVAGNGRSDFVLTYGWLEAPEDPYADEWMLREEFDLGRAASVPILVEDVNRDGVNELVVGGGHAYGLDWWERADPDRGGVWRRRPIDPWNSQYHDLLWVDIDGDGDPELVTGKRYRAHCGKDPGAGDGVGIYYFKWTGEGFAKQVIDYGPAREGKGCGISFAVADLRGTGKMDVIVAGKDGLYVYYNEGVGEG